MLCSLIDVRDLLCVLCCLLTAAVCELFDVRGLCVRCVFCVLFGVRCCRAFVMCRVLCVVLLVSCIGWCCLVLVWYLLCVVGCSLFVGC